MFGSKESSFKPYPTNVHVEAEPYVIEFLSELANNINLEYTINESKNEFTFKLTYELKQNPEAKYFLTMVNDHISENKNIWVRFFPDGTYIISEPNNIWELV